MTLSDENYAIIVVFLTHHLKWQGYRDIYLQEDFLSGITPATLHTATNLM